MRAFQISLKLKQPLPNLFFLLQVLLIFLLIFLLNKNLLVKSLLADRPVALVGLI